MKLLPRDFFLNAASMVTLYASAISLITLLFQYVNVLLPDPLSYGGYYYDPYSGAIRFAMATLLIMFPLYVLFTRLIHQDIRHHPEKREGALRKWLIYITLFVAGATIAGDLIALVNTFLSGELTARFLLKVGIILLVVGSGFLYYWYELKGTWERRERESKLIAAGTAVVVLAAVVGGFAVIGSPAVARDIRFDQERINHLQMIQGNIVSYWQSKEVLPSSLDELEDPLLGFVTPVDPETQQPYGFEATGPLSFELCAVFAVSSDEVQNRAGRGTASIVRDPYFGNTASWEHSEGEHCFERTIDPELFPPRRNQPLF